MTRKRKSMSIGSDVHALSAESAQPLRSNVCSCLQLRGLSGMLPDKSGPPRALLAGFAILGSLCSQYVQKVMKSLEKRSFREILSCSSLR